MPSEDWAFSPAGGARALDWSADVWRTKQPELRAGSTAEPVEREPRQRGNVTSGDLKLGTCARASRYRSGLTYVPRADWQDPQRVPPRGRRGQMITAAALAIYARANDRRPHVDVPLAAHPAVPVPITMRRSEEHTS